MAHLPPLADLPCLLHGQPLLPWRGRVPVADEEDLSFCCIVRTRSSRSLRSPVEMPYQRRRWISARKGIRGYQSRTVDREQGRQSPILLVLLAGTDICVSGKSSASDLARVSRGPRDDDAIHPGVQGRGPDLLEQGPLQRDPPVRA